MSILLAILIPVNVTGEIKNDILKRIIFYGATESSWIFKRFNGLQIMAIDKSDFKTIVSE